MRMLMLVNTPVCILIHLLLSCNELPRWMLVFVGADGQRITGEHVLPPATFRAHPATEKFITGGGGAPIFSPAAAFVAF